MALKLNPDRCSALSAQNKPASAVIAAMMMCTKAPAGADLDWDTH